jgi:ABC-type maltose transport system permease subunit
MKIIHTAKNKMDHLKLDTQFANDRKKAIVMLKHFLFGLFRAVVLIGISYVILSPVFGIIASSFFSDADNYNPMVFLIPQEPTLERYQIAMENMKYSSTVLVSSALFLNADDHTGDCLLYGRVWFCKISVSI